MMTLDEQIKAISVAIRDAEWRLKHESSDGLIAQEYPIMIESLKDARESIKVLKSLKYVVGG